MNWKHLVILLIGFVSQSDTELSIAAINAIGDDGSIKCGSEVILMCTIQPFDGNMIWKSDNTTMMSCTSGSCKTHPPFHPNYGFAFDRKNGVFNITINPVRFTENKKQFECNDGSTSQIFTSFVKVLPDNSTTVLSDTNITHGSNSTNSTNTTEITEITVSTGCMYPTENVQFQWYYFKEGETPIPYNDGQQTDGSTNGSTTDCTTGDCGGDGVKEMTSILKFQQNDAGEDYFFQAVVTSPDMPGTLVVTSNISYKLTVSNETMVSMFGGTGANIGLIIVLALIGVAIAVITLSIIVVLWSKGPADPEKQHIVRN